MTLIMVEFLLFYQILCIAKNLYMHSNSMKKKHFPMAIRRSFEGRVAESTSVGSLVLVRDAHSPLVIRASDRDTGINSLLYYEIMEEHARRSYPYGFNFYA